MICGQQGLQLLCGAQSIDGCSRNTQVVVRSCRAPHQALHKRAQQHPDFRTGSGSSNSSRRLVSCRAEPESVGGYTPADYITFSEDPSRQCHHNAEVLVDAPMDLCYSLWHDWTKLLDFLDLVGQIGLDNGNPHMALFQCFYRYRKLPLLEIVFLLERQEQQSEGVHTISFKSVYGMNVTGQVRLSETASGETRVQLYFTHPVPNLLVQLQIGPFGVETDLMQILRENMATYKAQVEAAAPPDWQQQKQQVAARVQEQQQALLAQQQEQQAEAEAEPQQPPAQQKQPPEQPPAAAQQQRGRTTASKGAAAETPAAPQQPQQEQPAAPEAAAAQQALPPSGRRTTRGRSVSKAAPDSSSSSSAGKRRSRMSSSSAAAAAAGDPSSNGAGTAAPGSTSGSKSSGRRSTTRRASKRPSTAGKD